MKIIKKIFPTFLVAILIFAIWEFIAKIGIVQNSFLAAPSDALIALAQNWDVIAKHSRQTLLETGIGMVIAIILGVGVAIVLDMSSWVRRAVYPLLIASQTVPIIALAPLFLVWFGFGLLPKVLIVILGCFFPIAIATLDGFANVDRNYMNLLKSMNASHWQSLRYVKLPGSMHEFFSGLKIAATYGVTSAVVGEFVGAREGLGIYMQTVAHSYAITLVFSVIIVISTLSLLLFLLVLILERIFIPWKYEKRDKDYFS